MSGVLLGTEKSTNKSVYISQEARRLGSYMVGMQGMGKTNLLLQIALQDIEAGHGVCVLSPHPDLIDDLLKRIPEKRRDDVIVFSPFDEKPLGINVFEWDGVTPLEDRVDRVADQVVYGIFKELWGESWGARMEMLMKMTARTIYRAQILPPEKRPTLREFADIVGFRKNPPYREFVLDRIGSIDPDSTLQTLFNYWHTLDTNSDRRFQEQVDSTMNKAEQFSSNRYLAHVLGQSTSSLDLGSVMNESKILLCDLDVSQLGEGNVGILGSVLVGRLFLAGMELEITDAEATTTPFHIIADEFRYFATKTFSRLQDELRKFNVDILIAHQRREGQLNDDLKSSTLTARNWVVFNVNPEDAEELAKGFDSTPPPGFSRAKQQEYELASMPWDELKRQSHKNQKVVDKVYYIDRTAFQGVAWRAGVEHINAFFRYAPSEITREKYEKFFPGFKDVFGMTHRVSVSTDGQNSPSVQLVNQYLYLRMLKKDQEAISVLEDIVNTTKFLAVYPDYSRHAGDIWGDLPYVGATDSERTILSQVMSAILPKIRYSFWGGSIDADRAELISIFLSFQLKLEIRGALINLGDLLEKEPVYTRGGEPVESGEVQRSHSDVTAEWKNRFAHLKRYDAWVRVEVDNEIIECHIQTEVAKKAPDNAEQIAGQSRSQSQERFGMSRAAIEAAIKQRMDVSGDLAAFEDISE